jgi:hypothetical protein
MYVHELVKFRLSYREKSMIVYRILNRKLDINN